MKSFICKTCILLAISLTLVTFLRAQEWDGADGSFIDTIFFQDTGGPLVNNLDSLDATILDSIEKPFGYVIRIFHDQYPSEICIALKKKTGYQLAHIYEYAINHTLDDSIEISRINFNGRGYQEVIIKYSRISGRSGWTNGWDADQEGFYIWDPDNNTLLGDFRYRGRYTNWWIEWDPTEPDSIANEDRTIINSGGDTTCYSYSYEFKKRELIFKADAECDAYNESTGTAAEKPKRVRYKLGKKGLIKVL